MSAHAAKGALMFTRPSQGRSVGFMASWCLDAFDAESQQDHLLFEPTKAQRLHGRDRMKLMGYDALRMLAKERPKASDADESEPEVSPSGR